MTHVPRVKGFSIRLAVCFGAFVLFTGAGAQAQRCAAPLPLAAGIPATTFNPVIVRVLGDTITPVQATDGLVHLAYAAQVTNLASGAAGIGSIVPVDGAPVIAAAAGTVVEATDKQTDQILGPPQGIAIDTAGGNHVIELEGVVLDSPARAELEYEAGHPVHIDRQGGGSREGEMPAEGHVLGFHLE